MLASAEQMEEARRRNVNADDLAMLPIPYDPAKLPQRLGVELKIDGIGLLDVNGELQSLAGAPFHAALHLAHELQRIRAAFGTEMVLHGEFFEPGGFNATLSSFRSGRSVSGAAILWDAVSLKAWHGYEQSPPLHVRRQMLCAAFEAAHPSMLGLSLMTEGTAASVEMIEHGINTAVAVGHEGVVVKDLDSPYQRGRSAFWMKAKPVETIDAPIQSVRLSETGHLRSIVVTFEGKPVVVGSGLSDALRHDPLQFAIGRMVEIRHVGRMESGALRGAAFVRFRDDKQKGARA